VIGKSSEAIAQQTTRESIIQMHRETIEFGRPLPLKAAEEEKKAGVMVEEKETEDVAVVEVEEEG
jgi:hypothetical protein